MKHWVQIVLLVGMGTASIGWSAIHRWGEEYELFGKLPGHQRNPDVAVAAGGGFAVWQNSTQGSNGERVVVHKLDELFSSQGGAVRLTRDEARTNETNPRVAMLPNGGAAVSWESGSRKNRDVYVRFLSATGQPIGEPIMVNAFTRGNQTRPDVAVNKAGNVVVVWESAEQDGDGLGVYAQRYTPQGLRLGGEIQVSQAFRMNQSQPTAAALKDGKFVVVWIGEVSHGLTQAGTPFIRGNVMGRFINEQGRTVGNEFRLDGGQALCSGPRVIPDKNGGFSVGWTQRDEVKMLNMLDVYFRSFNKDGLPQGAAQRQNKYVKEIQKQLALAPLDSEALMVWDCGTVDNASSEVHGRLLGGGAEFRVNTKTMLQQRMTAAAGDGNGRAVAVWVDVVNTRNTTLLAQKFSTTGTGPDLAAGKDVTEGPIGPKRYPLVMRVNEKATMPGPVLEQERNELEQEAVVNHENDVQDAARIAREAAAKSARRSLLNTARLAGSSRKAAGGNRVSAGNTLAVATRQSAAQQAAAVPKSSVRRANRPVMIGAQQPRMVISPTAPVIKAPTSGGVASTQRAASTGAANSVSSVRVIAPTSPRLASSGGVSRVSMAAQSTLRRHASSVRVTRQSRPVPMRAAPSASTAHRIASNAQYMNRGRLGAARLSPTRPSTSQVAAHRAMQQYAQRRAAAASSGNRFAYRPMQATQPRASMMSRTPSRAVSSGGTASVTGRAMAIRANAFARNAEANRSRNIPVPAHLERAGSRTNIRFNSESGRRYMLQTSADRNNWRNDGSVYRGNGRSMAIPVNNRPGQRFIRVVPTD